MFEKAEEECLCTFVISWLHGPNAGTMSSSGVASICIVNTDAPLNSTILTFSKLVKENIERAMLRSSSVPKSCVTATTKRKSISQDEIQASKFCFFLEYMSYHSVF